MWGLGTELGSSTRTVLTLVFFFFFLSFFLQIVSLCCGPGCLETHSVDQTGPDTHSPVFSVLGYMCSLMTCMSSAHS
jgi:hypothetical protein